MEIETLRQSNVSFLRARDPSILSYNIQGLNKVKADLQKGLFDEETVLSDSEKDENLRVYLRIKSNVNFDNLYWIEDETLVCRIPEGSHILRNTNKNDTVIKKYSFSKIFGPKTTQIDIFNTIVKKKLLGFINGRNSSIMTYGASGAGKTFTIVGTASEPGIVPRSLEYLFRTVPHLKGGINVKPNPNGSIAVLDEYKIKEEKQKRADILNASHSTIDRQLHIKTYREMQQRLSTELVATLDNAQNISVGVWISFAEIYNENLYDLLKPPPNRGKKRPMLRLGSANGKTFIKDLTSINVSSGLEAYQILQYGLHNLNYAATSINSNSSRSHSIFTIKLAQVADTNNDVQVSYFNFCDLAGSERLKKTLNVGDRLKESNNINTSLMVLGKCINAIRQMQNSEKCLVPFRESKLTQLFQNALSGHEDICMIVNINPSKDMFDESHHVLNFSAVAKQIIVEEQPIKHMKVNRFSQYLQGRSTSIQPIMEETETETETVEGLKDIIRQMYHDFEIQKEEAETRERLSREELAAKYRKIFEETNQSWIRLLKDRDEQYHSELKTKEEDLKEKYKRKYENTNAKRSRVIVLDSDTESSEDEIENELHSQLQKANEEIQLLQQEVTKLKFQNQNTEQTMVNTINSLKIQNEDLQLTLQDAENEYKNLEKEHTELKKVVIELRERVMEQDLHLSSNIRQLTEKNNYMEELEEKVALKNFNLSLTVSSNTLEEMGEDIENRI